MGSSNQKRRNSGWMIGLLTITVVMVSLALTTKGAMKPAPSHAGWTADNSGQKRPAGKAEVKQDSRKWERNLLSMVAASVACQTTTHLGYSWCVTLLTTLAVGVQGHEEQEPKTEQGRVSRDMEEEGGTSEQIMSNRKGKQCERTEVHMA